MPSELELAHAIAAVTQQMSSGLQEVIAREYGLQSDVVIVVVTGLTEDDSATVACSTIAEDIDAARRAIVKALESGYQTVLSQDPDFAKGRRLG